MLRETEQEITLFQRKWRIQKMEAQTGSWIALCLLPNLAPLMSLVKRDEQGNVSLPSNDQLIEAFGMALQFVQDRNQFIRIQTAALRAISEKKNVNGVDGFYPVILNSGAWGVEDIETNAVLVSMLTIRSLAFSLKSFFEEDALKEFQAMFTGLIPSSASI